MSTPVTVSITRHIDPAHTAEMVRMAAGGYGTGRALSWLPGRRVGATGARSPTPGTCSTASPTMKASQYWEHSPQRQWWRSSAAGLGVVESRVERRTGIEGWFDEPTTR